MKENTKKWIFSLEKKGCYQLLDRLRADCDYYLGNGNRNKRHLWAETEEEQMEYMKFIWNNFLDNEKPEWLTWEQILEYEEKMVQKR